MSFEEERGYKVAQIEEILKEFMPLEEGYQKIVMQAMNYSLMAGGKRLRPMLMQETFTLFGGRNLAVLKPFMAAMEMIHTYSLVHDDLPAMDDDEYRRGRKTTHIVFGEAMAILAGDGLLNYAFETAVKAFRGIEEGQNDKSIEEYKRVARAIEILSVEAGIYGMLGGQVVDVEEYQGYIDKNRLDFMYHLKTGALIEASMMIGAVLAGAQMSELERIEEIASDIGLAFQIKDDILDITSSTEALGKPVHSDEKNEKTTYVTIMDLSEANREVVRISERAIRAFEELPYKNDYLKELITRLITREY
jgi:geranylgeranyl diphosphate synthase type II